MQDQMTPLALYIEGLMANQQENRNDRVTMSSVSREAGLSGNMVWRIMRDSHIPSPKNLMKIAAWAGGDSPVEVQRVYGELMVAAQYGAPAPTMSDRERRVLELIAPLEDAMLSRFVEMLERFTVLGLTELMSGAEEGLGDNWPPILTVVLSPAERDLLRRFRTLPFNERDATAERMRRGDDDLSDDVTDFARLLKQMMEMSTVERSQAVRRILLEILDTDSTAGSTA
jgi:transcriptional regulator with XRE-family HTH domain